MHPESIETNSGLHHSSFCRLQDIIHRALKDKWLAELLLSIQRDICTRLYIAISLRMRARPFMSIFWCTGTCSGGHLVLRACQPSSARVCRSSCKPGQRLQRCCSPRLSHHLLRESLSFAPRLSRGFCQSCAQSAVHLRLERPTANVPEIRGRGGYYEIKSHIRQLCHVLIMQEMQHVFAIPNATRSDDQERVSCARGVN